MEKIFLTGLTLAIAFIFSPYCTSQEENESVIKGSFGVEFDG